MKLGNIRVLEEDEPKCIELHERLYTLNERFNNSIKQLVVPLRFSILALLSARKCTVFDESLVTLMEHIRDLKCEEVPIYKLEEIG